MISVICIVVSLNVNADDNVAITSNLRLIERLDSMINNSTSFAERKNERISGLKNDLRNATSIQEQYDKTKQIYDEYFTYDSDSAIVYVRKAKHLATKLYPNDKEMENVWKIKESFVYSACGLFSQALNIIKDVDSSQLSKELLPEYYNQMEYLYSHYALYADDDAEMRSQLRAKSELYKDSLGMSITQKHPYSLWYGVSAAGDDTVPEQVVERLQKNVDSSQLNSRNVAINAYWLSKAYEYRGDTVNQIKYMIMSAMADVSIVNRDIASLQELANYLFSNGDVNRAYHYMNYCMDQAQFYHNRIRVVSLSSMQEEVRKAYLNILEEKDRRLHNYLILMGVMLFLLAATIVYIINQYRKLKESREELSKLNTSLKKHMDDLDLAHKELTEAHEQEKKLNEDLQKTNEELNESNNIKQEYIGYAFTLSTDFINDLDDLRKKLLRKVKTRQFGELADTLESQTLVQEELKRFHKSFDETFIHIYPNFLEEYNEDQEPADRIELKEGELLNTKLRIWALHRLGITESAKIAKMLRCSIQTVYNNRPKKKKS